MKKEDMLLMAIKPFLPQIKAEAGKSFDALYKNLLEVTEKELQEGEDYAAIMIVRNEEECYLVSCAMSPDNQVLRKISVKKAEDLTNELLNKLL